MEGREVVSVPAETALVNVVVENLLGQRLTVSVQKAATVRQLKEEIETRMHVRAGAQTLIRRRPTGGTDIGYTQLEDAKTLDQYNLDDGERVLLVPSMKSAPPGYELKDGIPTAAKVFVDVEGSSLISTFIDKALAEKNEKRDPAAVYLLVQMPGQAEDTYTVVQYLPDGQPPAPERQSGIRSAMITETSGSTSVEGPEAETEADRQQNVKTQSIMSKIRAKIEKRKRKKQQAKAKGKCAECGSTNGCKCEKKSEKSEPSTSDQLPPFSGPRKSACNIS